MAKYDLVLKTPWMNAAGSLGFAPNRRGPVDLARLGAFITNPISLKPRTPARGTRLLWFSGGFLLHTGYPNPGLRQVIRRYARDWARAPLPVWVHLLAETPAAVAAMVARLERVEGVTGIELGAPPDADGPLLEELLHAAAGELPLVLRLPLDRAAELAPVVAALGGGATQSGGAGQSGGATPPEKTGEGTGPETAELPGPVALPNQGNAEIWAGTVAISLGPPRGALPDQLGRFLSGRLYGPAIYPLALAAVHAVARTGLPVFGAGGVYSSSQAESMLQLGAAGVQFDAGLWQADGWLSTGLRL